MSDSIQTWPPCDVPNAQGTAVGSKLTSHKSQLQICHQRIDWNFTFTIFSYWANLYTILIILSCWMEGLRQCHETTSKFFTVSSAYPQSIGSSRFRRYNSPEVWQACPLHHILHHLSLVQPVDGLEACLFKGLSENTFGPWKKNFLSHFPTWKIPAQTPIKESAAYSKGFPEFSEAALRQVTWCKFLTKSFVSDFRWIEGRICNSLKGGKKNLGDRSAAT